jgi:hypothetical protein
MVALTVFFLCFPFTVKAAELVVKSFKKAEYDLTAILNTYKRYDDNDELCAIVKVRSDIIGLNFAASTPIVGNVEYRKGEYWIYLSEGTRQLSIYAPGFIKLSYTFPERIKKGNVYIMEVTSRLGPISEKGKGNLIIQSQPDSVEVRIDGFPDLLKITPCRFNNYRSDVYTFKFSKDRYFPLDTVISIDKKVTKQIFVKLNQKWGDLIVNTNLDQARFNINGNTFNVPSLKLTGEKKGLDEGVYDLKISGTNHHDTSLNIAIKAGDTTFLKVNLRPITTKIQINTNPPGARISIDDQFKGYSPLEDTLIIGYHSLKITHKGYIDETHTIRLTENEPFIKNYTLRTHAKVWITSNPPGAKIILNGKYKGKTPQKIDLYTGPNILELKKRNYETVKKTIEVTPGGRYDFPMKKKKYHLTLISFPPGADIKINGLPVGQTKKKLELEYGYYKITVSHKGYLSRHKSLTLDRDKKVNFNLPPRMKAFMGATFFIPHEEYDILKLGGELGWSYQKIPHLLTSIGYGGASVEDMETHLNSMDVRKVIKEQFTDLDFREMKKVGFAVEGTNIVYWRLGWIVYKPITMMFSSVMGLFSYGGYPVYESSKVYQSNFAWDDDVQPGDRVVDYYGNQNDSLFKYGFGFAVKWSSFYAGFDYWPPADKQHYGNKFSVNIGLIL